MKHFKVRVQYLNGVEFVHECKTLTNWQAGAIARVEGRRLGLGGAMDVKETIVEDWAGYDLTQDQLDQIKEVEDAKNTM